MARLAKAFRRARRFLTGPERLSGRKLGDERRAAGDWAMAARHYADHVARQPADFDIWVQLGHAYKESSRFDDADAAYQSAADLNPESADLWLSRGHLAKLQGDRSKAADYYGRSFAIDGNPASARELGQSAVSQREPRQTIFTLPGALETYADGLLIGWIGQRGEEADEVEVLVDGRVIATGVADIARPDLVAEGLAREPAGFLIDLSGRIDLAQPVELEARLKASSTPLANTPLIVEAPEAYRRWSDRWLDAPSGPAQTLMSRIGVEPPAATLTILVPVTDDTDHLADLIASLQTQLSDRWEAVLAPNAKQAPRVRKIVGADPRFSVADDTAAAATLLTRAAGDHVLILSPDAVLEPEAVWRIVDAISQGTGFVYWDEALIGPSIQGVERFVLRPALSLDHLEAYPDLVGSFSVDRSAALAVLNDGVRLDWADSTTFRLACAARARRIAHVPSVLERSRRRSPQERRPAPAIAKAPTDAVQGRTLAVIAPGLDLNDLRATVEALTSSTAGGAFDLVVVSRSGGSAPMRRYLDRLGEAVAVFPCESGVSAAEAVNAAVDAHARDHAWLVLIQDRTGLSAGWLGRLLGLVAREGVGVAAPISVAADGRVASAGVGVGPDRLIHSHHGLPLTTSRGRSLGWNRSLVSLRDQSAASGCLAMRIDDFVGAGGLDSIMSDDTALVDLCLRLARTGRRTLVDPRVIRRTGRLAPAGPFNAAFRARWGGLIASGDPFLHPCLDAQMGLATLDTMFAPCRIRDIDPPLRPASAARLGLLERGLRIEAVAP